MVHTTSVSNGRAVVRETIGRHRQLADTLAERIQPDGSLDDHCGSRILESALLTRLLHRTGRHPEVYARLWSYLAAAAPVHEVERIVQRASWGVPGLKPEAEAFLSTFEHATGSRKKVLLTTVLAARSTPVRHHRQHRCHAIRHLDRHGLVRVDGPERRRSGPGPGLARASPD